MTCTNIPDLICISDYNGNYSEYEAAVYSLYEKTFCSKNFSLGGKPIVHKKHPMYRGMSCTFWHITSSGSNEANREPDLRRYERISWPAFILGYCLYSCTELLIWKNKRKGKSRTLLWCKDIDYIVILDERPDFYIFWTAYPTSYHHTREKLIKEYQAYISKEKAN